MTMKRVGTLGADSGLDSTGALVEGAAPAQAPTR